MSCVERFLTTVRHHIVGIPFSADNHLYVKGGSQSCPDQIDEVGVRGMYNGGRSRKLFLESNGYSWIIQIQWKKGFRNGRQTP